MNVEGLGITAVSPTRTPIEAELARALRSIVGRCESRMNTLREVGQIESTEADFLEEIMLIVTYAPGVYPA